MTLQETKTTTKKNKKKLYIEKIRDYMEIWKLATESAHPTTATKKKKKYSSK